MFAVLLALLHFVLARTLCEHARRLETVVRLKLTLYRDADVDVGHVAKRIRDDALGEADGQLGAVLRDRKTVLARLIPPDERTMDEQAIRPNGTAEKLSLLGEQLVDRLRVNGAALHPGQNQDCNCAGSHGQPDRRCRARPAPPCGIACVAPPAGRLACNRRPDGGLMGRVFDSHVLSRKNIPREVQPSNRARGRAAGGGDTPHAEGQLTCRTPRRAWRGARRRAKLGLRAPARGILVGTFSRGRFESTNWCMLRPRIRHPVDQSSPGDPFPWQTEGASLLDR